MLNLATEEDLGELQRAFTAINTSNTGKITIDELEEGFEAHSAEAKEEVKAIFDEVDLDGNGEIEFTEWIVASIDKQSLITDEKLKLAFQLFDKDGGGQIDALEVRATITGSDSSTIDDEEAKLWESIIAEVDIDGSGHIEFDEFCKMIKKIIVHDEIE